jgi:hypothetical protein
MGSLAILDLNTDIFLFLYSLQFLAEGDWAKPPPCNTPPYTERRFGLRAVKPTLREKRRFDLRARIPAVEPPVLRTAARTASRRDLGSHRAPAVISERVIYGCGYKKIHEKHAHAEYSSLAVRMKALRLSVLWIDIRR